MKSALKIMSATAALAFSVATLAEDAPHPTPGQIIASAPQEDWLRIAPEDLLVMDLAPDAQGQPRRVVIQLMPPPFSQGWVENIRLLAKAHWWDGLSVYRSVDNWVVQWGDGEEEEADRTHPAKPLPEGLNVVPESEYQTDLTAKAGEAASAMQPPDPYAHNNSFYRGFQVAGTGAGQIDWYWPVHCYASVGVARNLSPDTGTGAELYAVIGHAPRQLDRNIAVVGRVIEGIQHLSVLPRGTAAFGVYATEAEHTPIVQVRLASELPEFPQPAFEYLDTSSESFARYAEVSANRNDDFYKVPAGGIDICNLKVPIRRVATGD